MNTLNEARQILGVSIPELSEVVDIPYFELTKMLKGDVNMPIEIKSKIKFFLIQNYTKCIEKL